MGEQRTRKRGKYREYSFEGALLLQPSVFPAIWNTGMKIMLCSIYPNFRKSNFIICLPPEIMVGKW